MDARHGNYGHWYAAQAELDEGSRNWDPADNSSASSNHLRALWQQSAYLRALSLDVQAASVEARARSRDLRLRRSSYDLRAFDDSEGF